MAKIRTEYHSPGVFMGAGNDFAQSRLVLLGIPFDGTVSFRPGARFGPEAIRQASYGVEEYSIYQDKDLRKTNFYDLGDLDLPLGNTEKCMDVIYKAAKELFGHDKIPFALGGEHLVTWPLVRAAVEKYPDLAVLHFDAHADLREGYLGEKYSHASVIRLCSEILAPKAVYQFGIRSGDKPEFDYARERTNMNLYEVLEPLKKTIPLLKNRPVYVTIDIDVLDPAHAPGTGTPEAGGCTAKELLAIFPLFAQLNIAGFDLVEVAPHLDNSNCTAVLAAKLVREAILAIAG